MQTGGCQPTSAPFSLSLEPPPGNAVLTAVPVLTVQANITVDGPTLDPVPPGIAPDFAIERGGTFIPATLVALIGPNFFAVVIPFGLAATTRVRYVPAGPVWFNASGGRLLPFNVPLPFP